MDVSYQEAKKSFNMLVTLTFSGPGNVQQKAVLSMHQKGNKIIIKNKTINA